MGRGTGRFHRASCPKAEIPLCVPNWSHKLRAMQGMDPTCYHPAQSHLPSLCNSLLLHCTTVITTFQQWYHRCLGGSSDIVLELKCHLFPLYPPTPSSGSKNFQKRGFDNQFDNGFTISIPTISMFSLMSDFLSFRPFHFHSVFEDE